MPVQRSQLSQWLSSRDRSTPDLASVLLPIMEMRERLDREKAKCDRGHHGLCLIIFDLTVSGWTPDKTLRLAVALANRLRRSDDAGWLETGKLAVLLPHASLAGAWSVCTDVYRAAQVENERLPSEIFRYPEGSSDRFHRDPPQRPPDSLDPPAPPVGTGSIDAMLAQRVPRWKRALDIAGASLLLLICAPVMLLAAVLVRLSSRGPVIFRQQRAGRFGVPFTFYKFRTMVVGAEAMQESLRHRSEVTGPIFKLRRDPRVTRVGALLRRTSIDELPQLWNVLRGDMSLVGPRPATLNEVARYEPWQRRRLAVPQGLTGAWQIEGRGRIGFPECVRMDLRYAKRPSLIGDLRILCGTIAVVLTSRGAH